MNTESTTFIQNNPELEESSEDSESPNINLDEVIRMSPVEIQQEYFENLGDNDWVRYERCSRNFLLQNVAFALFGSPSSVGDMKILSSNEEARLVGYTSRQREQVMKVFEQLCAQSKYSHNDEDILMSVILVVCARPKPLKFFELQPRDYWVDLHQRDDIDIWFTAVFRVRKCIPTLVDAKSCRVYIDENARVYQNWDSYLEENSLPKCVVIVPKGGEYTGTLIEGKEAFLVNLSVVPSPSLGLKFRVLSSMDTASTVASVGALGVLGVAVFTPVAPVLLTGAAIAGISTGVYGIVRSSLHLRDRKVHEQTLSIGDSDARNSWLNITASGVGLCAGAASALLSKSAAAGANLTTTGKFLYTSVNVLRHANILTGAAGAINSLAHIISKYSKHGEKPTRLEIFQLSASLLFFCNAMVSNKTAESIIEDAQAKTINEYRATLRSNRHRKIFDKVSAESRRVQGNIQGNTEVIKGISNIANKDQFFSDVLRINKDVNSHKLKISLTADGSVNLNAQHKFDPSQLSALGKEDRSALFNSLGPAASGPKNVPTRLNMSSVVSYNANKEEEQPNNMLVGIPPGEIIRVGTWLIRVSSSGAENVASMLENLSQNLYADLMTVSFNLLSKLVPDEIAKLKLLSPDEDLIVQVVKFVFNYLKRKRPLGDPSRATDNGIVIVLKEFFQDGVVRQDTILYLKEYLMVWIEEKLETRNLQYPNKKEIFCGLCKGIRYC